MLRNLARRLFISPLQLQLGPSQIPNKTFSDKAHQSTVRQLDSVEKSFNQVILIGRVGNNPETRGTEEHPVVTFSLATNNYYNKDEEVVQEAEWHRIAVFKPSLKERVMKYMTKGARVMVNGRITYFERKDPGSTNMLIKSASIIAEDIMFFTK